MQDNLWKTCEYHLFLKLNTVVFDWCMFCHLLALFVLFMQRVRTARQEVVCLKYMDLYSLCTQYGISASAWTGCSV